MTQMPDDAPVTNRAISLKRLGGNEALLATMAVFFLEDAPKLMVQLDLANQAGDLPAVAQRTHSLKGLALTFEAIPFVNLAVEIETQARAGDPNRLSENISQLKIEFDRLISELQPLANTATLS